MYLCSFQTFRKVLDAEMKKSHRSGEHMSTKRIRKEKKPVTEDEERTLWCKGLLGNKNAQCLLYTLYYYIGKVFGIRPCEHRQLRVSNFVVEDDKITYHENMSKTYHGGLKDLKKKGRVVTHYCHTENDSEHKPCLVGMFKQYIDLVCDLERIADAFYFRPSKTDYKYENAPLGIHKLNSILPSLMRDAGLEAKTAHCLRVTTATSLFQGKHEEKLIRERTGHVSSALFSYEKANKEQQIAVSTSVGPCVTSEDKRGTIKALDEKEDEIFDMSDAELDTLLSEFDWSEFDNHAHRNIAPEQMMLSSNTFNNCSVNICFNTK